MRRFWPLFACTALAAYQAEAPNPPHLTFPRLDHAPSMAADTDLSSWEGAKVVSDFTMMMPDDKGQNRWPTVAHCAWGPDALYVAVEAFDPDPSQVHAFRHKRDEFGDIDFVGLDVDPTGTGQSILRLLVTPKGGQMDGIVTDNVGEDYSYDCLWNSVGLLTPHGYLVKFRVPYASLRRAPGEWGVRILRVIPRERRYGIAWPRQSNSVQCGVCQAAQVSGAPVDKPGVPFLVIPSISGGRGQETDVDPKAGPSTYYRLGLDLRFSTTTQTVEGTFRPDFANVDTDVDPLQINSRFKVFYPEHRPFFLEGMDLLGTQGAQRQFFSRAIGDPEYGLKVSGTKDWASWTVLTAKDNQGGAMVDSFSAAGGPPGADALPSRDTAAGARFRLDSYGSGLTVVGTDKLVLGGPEHAGGQSGGIYLTEYLSREFKLVATAVEGDSHLPQPDGTAQSRRGTATSLEFDWNTRNAFAWIYAAGTSPDLDLVSGFTDLQGYRKQSYGLGWVDYWNTGVLAKSWAQVRGSSYQYWDGHPMDHTMGLDYYLETKGRLALKVNWDIGGRTRADDEVTSAASRGLKVNLAWNRFSWAQTSLTAYQGRTIDLDNAVPARSRSLGLTSTGNVDSIAYGLTLLRTDLDQEGTWIRLIRAREAVLTGTWSLPRFFYVRTQCFVVRYDGLEQQTTDRFLKLFAGWQPNAFTNCYLGWSGQRRRDPANGFDPERMVQRGFFGKLAYTMHF